MHNQKNNCSNEITFLEIILFIKRSWKKLFISSIIGAFLGFVCWLLFAQYQGSIILASSNEAPLTWPAAKNAMSFFAERAANDLDDKAFQSNRYHNYIDQNWWLKNVSIINEDPTNKKILIKFESTGPDRIKVANALQEIQQFIKGAYLFLQVQNYVNNLAIAVNFDDSELYYLKVSSELNYLRQRLIFLERLAKSTTSSGQLMQLASTSPPVDAKYLPLNTQIAALKIQILDNEELILKNKANATNRQVQKKFVDSYSQLPPKFMDGKLLIPALLVNLADIEKLSGKDDEGVKMACLQIASDLKQFQAYSEFDFYIFGNEAPQKYGLFRAVIIGFFGALLLSLVICMFWDKVFRSDFSHEK